MNHSAEFRRCLEECDAAAVRKLWQHMAPHLHQPESDHEALATIHRARTEMASMRFRLRAYSHRWLIDNGYPSALPDEFKPRAERLYPQIAEGVGIAVRAMSELMRPAVKVIQGAMTDAVSEAYADGRTDAGYVKGRIMAARQETVRSLFGRLYK